jgi:conjugal transfer pilus assembly protein TraF
MFKKLHELVFWSLLLPAFLCAHTQATAAETTKNRISPFYERHSEGWFWYETLPDPEPEPEKTSPPETVKTNPPSPDTDGPPPLSAAWIKMKLPEYMERALDNPTVENVSSYYYLQRVAMDKSNKFSDVAQEVVTQDHALDEVTRRPFATYAVNEMNKASGATHSDLLRQISTKAGIVFVYHSDCHYCRIQAPVLQNFAKQYGFAVTAISLDGAPMPDGFFPEFITDSGQARELGVQKTPAMFLALPPDRTVELSQGVLSIDELSQRVAMAAKKLGVIDDASFERARPVDTAATVADLQPSRETAKDAQKLTEYIRNHLRLK